MKSGIYIIKNLINNKIYIGSAVNLDRRLKYHKWALEKGTHCNIHLQRAWKKFGGNSFCFEEYLFCKKEDLIFNEQLVIDAMIIRKGRENIYNISPTAGSTLGKKHSDETKKKIGLRSKGRWLGRHHTPETIEKMRRNNIGKNKGKKHSIEARIKMSKSRKGRKFSEIHKKNLSKSIKAYWTNKKI
jgi:group I intron endonuclease